MEETIKCCDCKNLMTYIGKFSNDRGNLVLKNYITLPTNSESLEQNVNGKSLAEKIGYIYNNVKKTPGKIFINEDSIVTRYDIKNIRKE